MNVLLTVWPGKHLNKSPFLSDYVGGVELDIRNLGTGLARLGHNVHFLCLTRDPLEDLIDGIRVHHSVFSYRSSSQQSCFRELAKAYSHAVKNYCLKHAIQVVNSHLIYPTSVVVARSIDIRKVVFVPTVSSLLFAELLQKPMRTSRLSVLEYIPFLNYRRKLIQSTFTRADRIVSIASHLDKKIREICPNHVPIQRILPGINRKVFHLQNRNSINQVASEKTLVSFLSIGRFDFPKRQDVLLRAIAHLGNRMQNVHVTFVGDGPRLFEMMNLAKECGATPFVTFTGFEPNSRIVSYLQQHDALLFASDSEGLPKVVIEALSTGLPVIGSRIEPVCNLLEDHVNGLLVENNVEEFAAAMEAFAKNIQLRYKLAVGATNFTPPTIEEMSLAYSNMFEELVGLKSAKVDGRIPRRS